MSRGATKAIAMLRAGVSPTAKALVLYDSMVVAINDCYRADEVKQIRDKALALEHYARQAKNVDAERKAIEIRIRAERRAGQLLAETERGKPPGKAHPVHAEPDLSPYQHAKQEAKISDTQAKRWQQLAAMPREDFEGALQDPLVKPTTSGLINADKVKPASDRALWLWGQLRDFERKEVLNDDVNEIVGEMSEALQSDVRRLIPQVMDWLGSLKGI